MKSAGKGGIADAEFKDGFTGKTNVLQVPEQQGVAGVWIFKFARILVARGVEIEDARVADSVVVQGKTQGSQETIGSVGQAVDMVDVVAAAKRDR